MIIRHSDEMKEAQVENMRGGKGAVTFKYLLNPDEFHEKGRLFAQNTIPVGASIGMHLHEGEFEIFYILQGTGTYYNNEEKFEIKAGDMAYLDVDNSHSLENTGDEPLVFMALILFAEDKR